MLHRSKAQVIFGIAPSFQTTSFLHQVTNFHLLTMDRTSLAIEMFSGKPSLGVIVIQNGSDANLLRSFRKKNYSFFQNCNSQMFKTTPILKILFSIWIMAFNNLPEVICIIRLHQVPTLQPLPSIRTTTRFSTLYHTWVKRIPITMPIKKLKKFTKLISSRLPVRNKFYLRLFILRF